MLFRATTVLALSKHDNRAVDLVVKRHLKLREGPRSSRDNSVNEASNDFPGGGSSAELSLLQAELEAQRSNIERIDSAGFKVISGLDDAVNRVENDLGKIRDTLSGLRQEVRGSHEDMASLKTEIKEVKKHAQDRTVVKRLEEQLNSANNSVRAIRQELQELASKFENELDEVKAGLRQHSKDIDDIKSSLRDRVSSRDHAKDMAAMRGELAQVRKQLEEGRSKPPGSFSSRELDILTSNIAKIGNRASVVESLQMEFEIFKGRVQRMEAAAQSNQSHQPPVSAAEPTSAYDRYDDHDYHAQELRSSRRKRPSSGIDTSPLPDTSSKRAATSSDLADTIVATQWRDTPTSSPVAETRTRTDNTRLTKSGKIDKKPQRPVRRSLIGTNVNDKAHQSKRRG